MSEYGAVDSGERLPLLTEEVEQGNALRVRVKELMDDMFERVSELSENRKKQEALLEELIEFERDIVNYEILFFMYSSIARCALNARQFDVAVAYAMAGIESNESLGDDEGVCVNATVLIDMACIFCAFKTAKDLEAKYGVSSGVDFDRLIEENGSKGDKEISLKLSAKKRPSSLKVCLDKELMYSERPIKLLMKTMGISRSSAMKYGEAAKELVERGEL